MSVAAGDVFQSRSLPVIDIANGGTVNGTIAALNHLLEITVPAKYQEGGTYVVPGHGRICDGSRGRRVSRHGDDHSRPRRRLIKKGLTLEQVNAAKAFPPRLRTPTTGRRAASGRRRCSSKRCTGRSMRSSVAMAFVLMASIGRGRPGTAGRSWRSTRPARRSEALHSRHAHRAPPLRGFHRLLGLGRHRGLALADGERPRRATSPAYPSTPPPVKLVRRGIRRRMKPRAISARPMAPRRLCACPDASTSPGRTDTTL
jgi:hypothetical protein